MSNHGPIYSMLTGKVFGSYVCIKTTENDSLYPNNINFYCLTGCDTNPNCDVNYPVSCYNGQGGSWPYTEQSHCCGLSGRCGDCINNLTYPCPEFCDGAEPNKTWSIECYNVASCVNAYSCGPPIY